MAEKKAEPLNDEDRNEIANSITEGFTSGLFDDGEGHRISWEITINKFKP